VVEKRITRDEVYIADEAFFTGTAAEVTPIREVDGRAIGAGTRGPITERLQTKYFDVVHGRSPYWLTPPLVRTADPKGRVDALGSALRTTVGSAARTARPSDSCSPIPQATTSNPASSPSTCPSRCCAGSTRPAFGADTGPGGALPVALEGHDLMAAAATGSGKTVAFLLPIMQRCWMSPRRAQAPARSSWCRRENWPCRRATLPCASAATPG
jgi:hypothetical protein